MKLKATLLLASFIQSKPLLDAFEGPLVTNTFGGLISSVPILGPVIAGSPIQQGQQQYNPIYQTNPGQQSSDYPYY
ncbi:hypothetical protein CONCODRAFT_4900 [Conidiobolus coronatus NRRL 28638]|uniref:Uncharacterized protein n=1 Tax=Conidiobolus coronatus (strain ATCC 28846 / CBS 209.66 / NRRL 28638) TaxID=796925 RepID=A0A137PB79_CONC2|nr:hypothetical protein CONCODRAFT_4900 [Conidiobolus coronatus NRRL 28638]|eukprot:KXN72263.1 hypothetical protein CONCODRAFT_4900 [Conidiobolus coronatus NRRL 28638]